jgi:hypothetical protein
MINREVNEADHSITVSGCYCLHYRTGRRYCLALSCRRRKMREFAAIGVGGSFLESCIRGIAFRPDQAQVPASCSRYVFQARRDCYNAP